MKNLKIIMLAVSLFLSCSVLAQVGINTDGSEADASAILDIKSTTKGVLIPRMTQTEIEFIAFPANGLLVFNTTDDKLYTFIAAENQWKEIAFGTGTMDPWLCGEQLLYDGQSYSTVQIGSQCWMSENLNIGTMINGYSNQTDNSNIERYCYLDNTNNCDIYGGLYQWDEMMQYVTTASTQGICPSGWHIPSDDEIKTLEMELGMTQAEADGTGFRGTNEGSKMAANGALWNDGALEIDPAFGISGFAGIPGGIRYPGGAFYNQGDIAYLWTSSENGSDAWARYLQYNYTEVRRITDNIEDYGFSVRCVRD